MVYRPNIVYLFGACEEVNGPLIERLLRDSIMSKDFQEPAAKDDVGVIPPHNASDRKQHMVHPYVMNSVSLQHAQSAEAVVGIWTMLLAHGADIHNLYCGRPLLEDATRLYEKDSEGSLLLVNFLLQNGAKVSVQRSSYHTFLSAIPPPKSDFALHKTLVDAGAVTSITSVCDKPKSRVYKTVDFLLDYNPAMANDESIEKAILSVCEESTVPVLRTLLRRRKSKINDNFIDSLSSGRLDPRMMAFLKSISTASTR